jgi:hypothetical protein
LSSYRQATELADQRRCLNRILQFHLRVHGCELLSNNNAEALARILDGTPRSNSWATIRLRLSGSSCCALTHCRDLGASRAWSVGGDALLEGIEVTREQGETGGCVQAAPRSPQSSNPSG